MDMKKNERRRRALERLDKQIKTRRMSIEFAGRIEDMDEDKRKKAIEAYWKRREEQADKLRTVISSF